jgi:hypothetical protein
VEVCEPVLQSGKWKGRSGTGTLAGVRRHHQLQQPACDQCFDALKRLPKGKNKEFMFQRNRTYRDMARRGRTPRPAEPVVIERHGVDCGALYGKECSCG